MIPAARAPGGDERDRRRRALQRGPHGGARLGGQVREDGGLEDERRPILEHARQLVGEVAAHEQRRTRTHDLDRAREPLDPLLLAGPDEAFEQPRALVGRHVDGREVDADAAPSRAAQRPAAPPAPATPRDRSTEAAIPPAPTRPPRTT